MIRVMIPYHLKMLAKISGEVQLDVAAPVTLRSASMRSKPAPDAPWHDSRPGYR